MSLAAAVRRRGNLLIAGGAVVGIALPSLAEATRPLLLPLSTATMLLALLRVEPAALAGVLRRPWLALLVLGWVTAVVPLLVYGVLSAALAPDDPWLRGGVLIAAAPSVMSAAAFALLLGADAALLTVVALPSNALAPLVLPAAAALLGVGASLDPGAMAMRLALLVGIAFGGAALVAVAVGRPRLRAAGGGLDTALVLFVAASALPCMADVGPALREAPGAFAAALGFALGLNLVLQAIGAAVFWRAPARAALSAGLVSGSRNNVLLLAAIAGSADAGLGLVVACAQLTLFIAPAMVAPAYRRLAARRERA
jgi:BASS family bile acid:Na+ symporter